MPDDAPKTCPVLMHNGKPCGRKLWDNEYCICHSSDPSKNVDQFRIQISEILDNRLHTGPYDFSGMVFPRTFHEFPRVYDRVVFFDNASFLGDADFVFAEFRQDVDFSHARFSADAKFQSAKFYRDAKFENTQFTTVDFSDCTVRGESQLIFDGEELGKQKGRRDREMFLGKSDFRRMKLTNSKSVVFRKVDLGKCLFLETDVTKVEFVDVKWDERGKLWWRRKRFHDAVSSSEYVLLAQLYRRVQQNYVDSYQYRDAGDFYIGEQDMINMSKGSRIRRFFSANFWYWVFARYGQCWVQPLLTGVLPVLYLWSLLLILCDIHVVLDYVNAGDVRATWFHIDWLGDLGRVSNFAFYYLGVLIFNIRLVTTGVFGALPCYLSCWQSLVIISERILLIAFISFFVLALTRQFKRKSF